jgi:hypothetical protein
MINRIVPRWLDDRGYQYESVDGDFTGESNLGEHSLITTYPDWFRRVI